MTKILFASRTRRGRSVNRSSARTSFEIKPQIDPNSLPGSFKIQKNHETSSPKRSKIEVWGRSGRLFDLIGASMLCLGASCVCLVASWVPLRASWEPLGRRPGRILGSHVSNLGAIWELSGGLVGTFWDLIGTIWEQSGGLVGALRSSKKLIKHV